MAFVLPSDTDQQDTPSAGAGAAPQRQPFVLPSDADHPADPSVGEDLRKTAIPSAVRATEGVIDMPQNTAHQVTQGWGHIINKGILEGAIGIGRGTGLMSQETADALRKDQDTDYAQDAKDYRPAATTAGNAVTGPMYKPQTVPGQIYDEAMGIVPYLFEPGAAAEKLLPAAAAKALPTVAERAAGAASKVGDAALKVGTQAVAPAAASVAAGNIVGENSPWHDQVKMGASILGGAAGVGAEVAARSGANTVRNFRASTTEAGQTALARQRLEDISGMPAQQLSDEITLNRGANPGVDGSNLTLAQTVPNAGLAAGEKQAYNIVPSQFDTQLGEQNTARVNALQGLESPAANPVAIADAARTHLSDIDAQTQAQVDRLTQDAQSAHQRSGVAGTPEEIGAAARAPVSAAYDQGRQKVKDLYQAVEANGPVAVDLSPVRAAQNAAYGDLGPSARQSISQHEQPVLSAMGEHGNFESLKEVGDFQGLLATAMRNERTANGNSPALRRLQMLRGAVDDAVNNTIHD
nr:hypothetical protein [Pseudomonadota bacterium]